MLPRRSGGSAERRSADGAAAVGLRVRAAWEHLILSTTHCPHSPLSLSHFPLATSPPLPDLAEGRGVGSGAGRGGGGGSVGVGAAGWEVWLPSLSSPSTLLSSAAGHDDDEADCDDDAVWIRRRLDSGRGGGSAAGGGVGGGAAEQELYSPSAAGRNNNNDDDDATAAWIQGGKGGHHRPEGEAGGAAGGRVYLPPAKMIFVGGPLGRLRKSYIFASLCVQAGRAGSAREKKGVPVPLLTLPPPHHRGWIRRCQVSTVPDPPPPSLPTAATKSLDLHHLIIPSRGQPAVDPRGRQRGPSAVTVADLLRRHRIRPYRGQLVADPTSSLTCRMK
uniref:Uncharacterized protein n=1 Tax=Oryza sativa subsp. japonica TaxID=39947 RepID=Q9AUN4_ORYSJ|nr:Hypothetical protein [Oryza sativa Japonica Group]